MSVTEKELHEAIVQLKRNEYFQTVIAWLDMKEREAMKACAVKPVKQVEHEQGRYKAYTDFSDEVRRALSRKKTT